MQIYLLTKYFKKFLGISCGGYKWDLNQRKPCDNVTRRPPLQNAQWVLMCKGSTVKLCTNPPLQKTIVQCKSARSEQILRLWWFIGVFFNVGAFFLPILGTIVKNTKSKKFRLVCIYIYAISQKLRITIWVHKMCFLKMYIFGLK